MFPTLRRRFGVVAACACTSALTLGAVAITGGAQTQNGTRASKSGAQDGPGVGVMFAAGDQNPAVRDVFRAAIGAIGRQTPGIAKPIVEQAVVAGKITQPQADELRKGFAMMATGPLVQGPPEPPPGNPPGPPPSSEPRRPPGGVPPHGGGIAIGPNSDPNVRAVFRSVMDAVAKQAPSIVKPIVDQAVTDKKITQAQADGVTRELVNFGHPPKLVCENGEARAAKAGAAKKSRR